MNRQSLLFVTLCSILALCSIRSAAALDAGSTDPQAIMSAVSNRPMGDRAVSHVKMTIHDGSGSRERVMRMRGMSFETGKKTDWRATASYEHGVEADRTAHLIVQAVAEPIVVA